MRRLMKIMLMSLAMGMATLEASAQPPVPLPPPVPAVPSTRRVVRDVDATVRRATPARRRVRRHVRRRHAVRHRANALTLRPPVRGLPVIRLPKPPIPR